jgi:hypothetical protein
MPGIMSDNDVGGQFKALVNLFVGETWKDLWVYLAFSVHTFESIGLSREATDRDIWLECQKREIVLVTGNRNQDGPDSLETTLRALNTVQSLPVLTLADPQRILHSRDYADKVAEKMLEYLTNIENHRGAGRLFVP